ncbi:MAG: hypothetical protein EXQ70_04225 [Solirubrobacterales bacterium]|nr:hypothetical protein [Solirubrobacterales bacterium]
MWDQGGRRRRTTLAVMAATLTTLALAAAPALADDAETFTVNVTGDASDVNLGDGLCDVDLGLPINCTLRAAVGEAGDGDTTSTDTIGFDTSGGGIGLVTTLTLGGMLPDINEPTIVDGCSATPASTSPCVGVRATSTATDVFRVTSGGSPVTIRGLALTNAFRGVAALVVTDGLQIQNDWFGIKVDGTGEAIDTGVAITADDAVIGGTTAAARNVFANAAVGVTVFRGDDTVIQGNYFGTNAAGTAVAANGKDIELGGNGSDDSPTGTVIDGTQPTPAPVLAPAT